MRTLIVAAAAALLGLVPLAASAQEYPSYAQTPPQDEQIRGRIVDFDGGYSLTVRDDRGFIDNIRLHDGTIINPTGLTLAPGMVVSILGDNAGSFFGANEIDTPYTFYQDQPYYAGHPYGYYDSAISLDFFFGDGGWWHHDDFYGPYHYDGGARVYQNVNLNNYGQGYGRGNGYGNGYGHGYGNSGSGYGNGNRNGSGNAYGTGSTSTGTTGYHYGNPYGGQTTSSTTTTGGAHRFYPESGSNGTHTSTAYAPVGGRSYPQYGGTSRTYTSGTYGATQHGYQTERGYTSARGGSPQATHTTYTAQARNYQGGGGEGGRQSNGHDRR